jgi:hypothetical protein
MEKLALGFIEKHLIGWRPNVEENRLWRLEAYHLTSESQNSIDKRRRAIRSLLVYIVVKKIRLGEDL